MANAGTKLWLGNQEALSGDYHILHPIAFSSNMSVPDCQTDGSTPAIKVGGHGGGNPPAVAWSIMPMNSGKDYKARVTDVAQPLMAGGPVGGNQGGDFVQQVAPAFDKSKTPAVAFDPNQITSKANLSQPKAEQMHTLPASATAPALFSPAVRRLTPVECERLQGFPDDYTLIPYRNRMAADGPRYKAMGNSMAVPVMRWIGERISEVEAYDKQ